MKKIKIFLGIVLFSLFSTATNVNALISKNNVERLQSLTAVFALIDQYISLDNKRTDKYKYWPNLKFQIPLNKILEHLPFKTSENNNLDIYAPGYLNKILLNATGQQENLLYIIISGLIRAKEIEKKLRATAPVSSNVSKIKRTEGIIIALEKIFERIADTIINKSCENKILKRGLNIINKTAASTGGAYLRQQLNKDLQEYLPGVQTTAINSFFENLICETAGEILQRWFIDNPKTKKKEAMKHEQEAVFAGLVTPPWMLARKKQH